MRFLYAATLLVIVGLGWMSPPQASAQLLPPLPLPLPLPGRLVVTITSPLSGQTVSGATPVTASVSIVGGLTVVGVQFRVDGNNIGGEDTSGPSYSVSWNTTATSDGTHTLTAVARDILGVRWTSAPVVVKVSNPDTTPPSVSINRAAGQADPTNAAPINFTAVFSEFVSGFTGADVTITGTAEGTKTAAVTGGPSTYNVAVSGMTTSGTVVATIGAGVAQDAAGNGNTASTSSDNEVSFNAPDATPPAPPSTPDLAAASDSGVSDTDNLTNATTPTFTGTADAGSTVRIFSDGIEVGSGTATGGTYTITTGPLSDGAHSITATATDAASNVSSPSDALSVTIDTRAPTAAIDQAAGQADPANAAPINFTVVFSESVSGFTGADVTITGTAGGDKTVGLTGGPSTYDVAVSGMTTSGTVIATIGAGVAQDAAGNPNAAATSSDNEVSYEAPDATPPAPPSTPDLAAASDSGVSDTDNLTNATTPTFTGTADAGSTVRIFSDGIEVGSGTATGGTYSITSNPLSDGTHSITATATDAASNVSSPSDALSVTIDTTAPAAAINQAGSQPDPTNTSPIRFTVAFSESVSGFTPADVTITGTAEGTKTVGLTGGPSAYDVAVSGMTTSGTVIATIGAGVAQDAAGNPNAAATSTDGTVTFNTATTALAATRFEETDPSITYAPGIGALGRPHGWWHGSRSRGWSGVTAAFNRSDRGRATFRFTVTTDGGEVRWIGFRAPWAGIARVSVDGEPPADVDLFLPPSCTSEQRAQGCVDREEERVPVFTRTGLQAGEHTLTVESTGRKRGGDACHTPPPPAPQGPGPDCSADWAVVVDAFDVTPASPPPTTGTRSEETSIDYTGAWTRGDTSTSWSGGTASFSSPTPGAAATFTFTGTEVRWIGLRGPQTGIADVFLDGTFHAAVDTFSPTEVQGVVFTATGLAAGSHELRIVVTGGRNARATGASIYVDAIDVRSRFEDPDPSITYTVIDPAASWVRENMDQAWSGTAGNTGGGTAARSTTRGAVAEFTFTGTEVSWIGLRGPQAGIAEVFLDDAPVGRLDLYSPVEELRVPVFTQTDVPAGEHRLRINVTGERNPLASGAVIVVDAFDVTLPSTEPPVRRFQETGLTYTGEWTRGTKDRFWSGETAAFSGWVKTFDPLEIAVGQATFTFEGTSVRWIGDRRRDGGIARVLLDGVFVTEVDTFAPTQDEFQAVLFSREGLSPGSHTLTIDVTGRKNVGSGGYLVVVDAFEVSTRTESTATADTTPPTVAVTSPGSGAPVSGPVPVTASASDNVGVVGVRFKLDGADLGAEDTTEPYEVAWDTTRATNGSHALTAVARDAAGNITTSAEVTVTVSNSDATPPTVAIRTPENGSSLCCVSTVQADASDNVAVVGVRFFVDGAEIGVEDTTNAYAVDWDTRTVTEGSHTLTVVARDAAGNTTTSAGITVTVSNSDTTAPSVSITSPASGAPVSGTITVTASASDNRGVGGVQFRLDGAPLGAEDTAAPYEVAWDTTRATNGSHALTAVARDVAGNTTTSATVTVTVANETAGTVTRIEDANTAVITYIGNWIQGNKHRPWSGDSAALGFAAGQSATLTFNGTGVRWIGWRGPATGIAKVRLDGEPVATLNLYRESEEVQAVVFERSGLPSGSHTLVIEVTGDFGNPADPAHDRWVVVDAFDVTRDGTTIASDTTRPAVSITSPVSGATVSGTIAVTASAADDVGVEGVQFRLNDVNLAAEDTAAPYSVAWDTRTAADGIYTLRAVARDAAENITTSAPVTVMVANEAPAPATTATRFENTDRSITYTPGTQAPLRPRLWWHGSRSRGWSGKTSSFNRSAGAQATFRFTGTEVRWIGFRGPWAGIARVSVDGGPVIEIDLFSPTDEDREVIFSRTGLDPSVPHTLTVESTGRKRGGDTCPPGPDCSADWAVVVDAFDVAPASPPPTTGTRFEETDLSIIHTPAGGWSQGDATRAWSSGTTAASATPGAEATFTFTGTEVRWVGLRGPQTGIAHVFLDGAFHATVDTYSPTEIQAIVFTATGLAAGSHELRVVVTDRRNARSTGNAIFVDAFDVRSRFEDPHPSIAYTSGWIRENMDWGWSGEAPNTGGGTAARSATAGAVAEFTFTGSSVSWIGAFAPWAGIARVSVDRGPVTEVDLYRATEEIRVPVFGREGLDPGVPHSLTIEMTGLSHPDARPDARGAFIAVDAFDVTLPSLLPPVTRFQETALTYTPGWTLGSRDHWWSGETAAFSGTVNPVDGSITTGQATFTFEGTSVRWIGDRRRNSGIARVSVDGGPFTEVDTFAPTQDEYQAVLFSGEGLDPRVPHTLTIEVTGRKNDGSAGYLVVVDAFDVTR